MFRHGTLEVEIYAPRERDPRTPHTRDEIYVVIAGTGWFVNGPTRERAGRSRASPHTARWSTHPATRSASSTIDPTEMPR